MLPSEIRVNTVYGAVSSKSGLPLTARTVDAIFNRQVRYSYPKPGGQKWDRIEKVCTLKQFARWAEKVVDEVTNEHRRFLDDCRTLVARLGTLYQKADRDQRLKIMMATGGSRDFRDHAGAVYMDEHIVVVTNTQNGAMQVERRENRNPVIYVDPVGKPYRFHGEWTYLKTHVAELLA